MAEVTLHITEPVMKKISEMTREEINEELIAEQRRVVENFDDHMAQHQLVRVRTQAFMNAQFEDVHIDGRGEGDIKGLLPQDGQYL